MNRKEFRKQLDARFDAFEEKFNASFDKFNERLDAFEEKFNASFDKFNARLDKLNARLESGLEDIDKMIKEQKKTYEQINDSLSIIQRDCQNNEDSY